MTIVFDRSHNRSLQMALNEKIGSNLTIDGNFGKQSIAALQAYQEASRIPATGIYDSVTQTLLEQFIQLKYLNEANYIEAAAKLNVQVAAIKAVVAVETTGSGFLPDGRCMILFERHKFYKYLSTKKSTTDVLKFAALNPNILNRDAGGYYGKEKEYTRINSAIAIDEESALMSASWGMFQIMGFNFALAGFKDVFSFVSEMKKSENNQLRAFVGFVASQPGLQKALAARDWDTFARLYNGTNYKINSYHTKLASAYNSSLILTA